MATILCVNAGTPVAITVTFTNLLNGQLADPSTITMGIVRQGQSPTIITTGSITRLSLGLYQYIFDTTSLSGLYSTQAQGAGAIKATTDLLQFTIVPAMPGLT